MSSQKTLKVLSWNVWHDNYSFDEIQQVIRDSNADVVALFEVNPNVAESLRPFESEYTSSYWEMESPASVVVLSRVPGTRYDLKHPAGFNMPALEIQVPWPPSEPNASAIRNLMMGQFHRKRHPVYLSIREPHEITNPIFTLANPYARRTTAGDCRMVPTAKGASHGLRGPQYLPLVTFIS